LGHNHVEGAGEALFSQVCRLDLGGIVAKHKTDAYVGDREKTTWFKIGNRDSSQMAGRVELFERERRSEPVARVELFERERRSEPVAGWHACELACARYEETSETSNSA
jgi:hypothetical protein